MLKFKAVSHRLIFWILGACATLFLLISFYEQATAEHYLRQQVRSKASLVKLDMLTRVDNLLNKVSHSVNTVAAILPIVEADEQAISKLLKNVVAQQQDIYGMAIALEPGWTSNNSRGFAPYFFHSANGVAYTNLSKGNYNYRQHPWYREAVERGEAVWSEPYYDEGGGNIPMVTYSLPIYTDDGRRQLIGVVTADIALDRFAKMVSHLALGEKGFAYIFTRKGNIITHSIASRVMENIVNTPPRSTNKRQYLSVMEGIKNGQTDTLHLGCPQSENDECWLSYQPITGTDWSIAILIPMNELSASLLHYRYISLGLTITGLVFLALIVVFISRRVTKPLIALTESSRALARGDLDTPIDDFQLNDEVGTLARQFKTMQSSLKTYIEQLNQQTARRERLEGELSAAHDIQMQMLPDQGHSNTSMPDWELSALLEPAKSVGGDFYHYQLLNDEQLFFAVGDVSDKGVAAALFMAKTQTLLRQLCHSCDDLAQLLAMINQQLCQDNSSCMFVTLMVGVLNVKSGELSLCSAGHPPPIIGTSDSHVVTMETGPALGFYPDATFISKQLTLAQDKPLIITTDGVDEATNTEQQFYGEQRFLDIIKSSHDCHSMELLQNLYADVVDFRATAEASDDLTIMIIRRKKDYPSA